MMQDDIGRIADAVAARVEDRVAKAVHDRLMNGPLKEIRDDIRVLRSDMKGVKDGLAHLSSRMDEHFGA